MNHILCTIEEQVAIVTINRPKVFNALNLEVLADLNAVLDRVEQEAVKVMILTGAGEKSFAAGADVPAIQPMTSEDAVHFSRTGHKAMNRLERSPFFTIAAVNGYALGGGCEVAMACDMRVASTNAKLGIPEAALGLFPGFGGTQRLPRMIGLGRAKELLATAQSVSAAQALEWGLVNHVVEQAELLPFCRELAGKIIANSASAIRMAKHAMTIGMDMDLDKAMEYEAAQFGVLFTTPDAAEGMAAFVEKRKPSFQ